MSKQINPSLRIVFTVLVALGLLVAALVLGGPAATSAPQRAGAATSATRNAAIVATTISVLKETSEIRQLSILRPVKSGAQTRTEIERMVVRNLDEQTTPAEMHATEVELKKFGLVPDDFQYRSFVIKLLTEQVAGYYDTKARQFYLADWIELEGQKPVMAHELTHALQDQHFDLRRFEEWPEGDADAEMAAHALIEGDAMLSMSLYMAKHPLVALAFMRSLSSTMSSSEQFKSAPRALRDSLVFPYEQGHEWVTRLYKRGGWPMVSQAFTKLPQSTEQIMHPEKYLASEAPVKVTLPDVRSSLGPGWKKLDYDVNGEWGYYLVLDQFLNATAESKRAAAGWAGDRYAVYESSATGAVAITQLTVWDTPEDAREFYDAYVKRTGRRYPDARPLDIVYGVNDKNGKEARLFQTSEGNVALEIRGTRVLIVDGAPGKIDLKALLTMLWQ
jgi:hypothetical protein